MDNNVKISQSITDDVYSLAQKIVFTEQPDRNAPTTSQNLGYPELVEYTQRDLNFLAEALLSNNPGIYENQTAWLQSMLLSHGVPEFILKNHLEATRKVLLRSFEAQFTPLIENYLARSKAAIDHPVIPRESLIKPTNPNYELAWRYHKTLLAGDRQQATQIILTAIRNGTGIPDIYMNVIQPSLYEVGRLWQTNDISVAQEHFCSAATQMIMSQLYPTIFNPKKNGHSLIACCAPGELHEIGLRMVSDLMEMKGWDTHFLGANTPLESIVETIRVKKANVVMLSASLPPYVGALRPIIKAIREEIPRKVKIIVGGFYFTLDSSFSKSIPADGFAVNALEAVELTERMVK
jgi:MerR family transcriptional regulator, light-induced transcriptional regulator